MESEELGKKIQQPHSTDYKFRFKFTGYKKYIKIRGGGKDNIHNESPLSL